MKEVICLLLLTLSTHYSFAQKRTELVKKQEVLKKNIQETENKLKALNEQLKEVKNSLFLHDYEANGKKIIGVVQSKTDIYALEGNNVTNKLITSVEGRR